ncbi:MAG: hypothetical protein PVG14_07550 [Anaerolineales bacterium]
MDADAGSTESTDGAICSAEANAGLDMPKLDLSNKENNANNVIIEIRMKATIAKPRFFISNPLSIMSRITKWNNE